jgi:two-component system chemotaxis sensor kinase CheA
VAVRRAEEMYVMDELDEIVHEFLAESRENLDQLDRDLVLLEQQNTVTGATATAAAADLLQGIFRTVHTIKGTSGFLAYGQLEALAHAGEGLLGRLRDGGLALTVDRATALLELVDAVREVLDAIERTGAEDGRDRHRLVEKLTALQEPEPEPGPQPEAERTDEPERPDEPEPELDLEPPPPRIGEILVDVAGVDADDVTMAVLEQRLGDERPIGQILVDRGLATEAQVAAALAAQADGRSAADGSIRVDVGLLDALMRLVGELVLTRNQIAAATAVAAARGDTSMERSSQQLSQLVGELQAGVMKTRMQPIDTVWNRLPRVVRDLAVSCGRQVRLELEGREIELDRAILEAIKDPLIHIVRNSIDHGIEPPDVRLACGKPAEGCLTLRAFHEGGQVNIEVSDDGAGIDPAVVAAKAVSRGLVSSAQAAAMTARELTNLIFVPGFSTAEKITNVSGRGVGMDVVRTNIEKIGGTVEVASEAGRGTTLSVRIPLTLAIVPALTIECAGQRYAVPQVGVKELISLSEVEYFAGAPVFRLRGTVLPLVRLDQLLGLSGRAEPVVWSAAELPVAPEAELAVLVLQVEDYRFGLVVDAVLSSEEIVVKPLSGRLQQIGAYAGATILGDGRVALILDVRALARRADLVGDSEHRADGDRPAELEELEELEAVEAGILTEQLLIVAAGGRRIGLPLSRVTRLEEVRRSDVEQAGPAGRADVVQYRGDLMRLGRLAELLGATDTAGATGTGTDTLTAVAGPVLNVVVCMDAGRTVGLVVDAVLDIASEVAAARRDSASYAISGVAVVQGLVTEILDVDETLHRICDPAVA